MKTILFATSLVFAALGCKKGDDCAKALDRSMELSKADMAKMPGVDDKMLQKMKDVGVQHCRDDKWPDDVTKCMIDAKTESDSQACYGKLSPELQEKMNKAAMELMKPAAAPTSDPGSAAAPK